MECPQQCLNGKEIASIQPRGELVLVDYTFFAIKLSNLTMKDAGKYTCSASNAQSYRSDIVELKIVEGKYM